MFITSKGTGYVKIEGRDKDTEIPASALNTALHGDKVEVRGNEIVKILDRAKIAFSGELEERGGIHYVMPDNPKMYVDILVSTKNIAGAKLGDKVFAEIIFWKDAKLPPEGKIIKVFGRAGENSAEMHAIAMERGFAEDFPADVLAEAERIKHRGITEDDYRERRDFRKTLTFTIDPADAKDFDDAISIKEVPGRGWEIGVHIADVTHYVRLGSALEREARKRGTSVYLVDRTIPMLPEALSNDLCSLRPEVDRLTMSAVFILDKEGKIKEEWFGKSVIHSKKRFTYEEAEEAIKKPSGAHHKELALVNQFAKKMTRERMLAGAMSLDQEEVRFVLDGSGRPIQVVKKARGDSHRLVEEFMLLANQRVAEAVSKEISVYRVHDLPSREKTEDLRFFLENFGYRLPLRGGVIPSQELNRLLESLEGKAEKDTIHRAVVRSMAKAIYSTKNIGHFGLALKYYTHFTSPIRRYPDIMVHRILAEHLRGVKIKNEELYEFEELCTSATAAEKRAQDAEWASVKYKQVEYMSSRIGKIFEGIISGIAEWGIYVEEKETKSEGLIRMRDLADDYYVYNEKKMELSGQRKKKKFRLGDKVKIRVKSVDLERKTIDYVLV